MKLIVGLGNPGVKYRNSRHNLGFLIADSLTSRYKLKYKILNACSSRIAKHKNFVIGKPQTYMNLSGSAVKCLVKKFRLETKDILVVFDDINLELGRFKITYGGSYYGHNGLKSVIESLHTKDVARLRLGIGTFSSEDLTDFVLGNLTRKEKNSIDSQLETIIDCCQDWVEEGIDFTMNKYNKRKKE
ncbi:MAG: aminoacyl-tRNA hydrolase [Candidatus Gygaella obscura]|nr:aminoacyl-tRNA hydrolase [Candidatus Gygaella obscura]